MNDWVKHIYMWIHMQRNITHEKEGNPSIWDSIDGSSGHAKWDESDRERQRLCDIVYKYNLTGQAGKNSELVITVSLEVWDRTEVV